MAKKTHDYPPIESIKDFPKHIEGAKLFYEKGILKVVVATSYWSEKSQRNLESRIVYGRVIDGQYYSNEEYRMLYTNRGRDRATFLNKSELQVLESHRKASQKAANEANKAKDLSYSQQASDVSEAQQALQAKQASDDYSASESREDDVFNLNPLGAFKVGPMPLIYDLLESTGAFDDLNKAFGNDDELKDALISLVAFNLLKDYYGYDKYNDLKRDFLQPGSDALRLDDIASLLSKIGKNKSALKAFYEARVARCAKDELIVSSFSPLDSEGSSKAQSYSLCYGKNTNLPLSAVIKPFNMEDITSLPTAFKSDASAQDSKCAVLDSSLASKSNLNYALKQGMKVVMEYPIDNHLINTVIDDLAPTIETFNNLLRLEDSETFVHGLTVERSVAVDGKKYPIYVHVYKRQSGSEQAKFLHRLVDFKDSNFVINAHNSDLMKFVKVESDGDVQEQKTYSLDDDKINEYLKRFSYFVSVSTYKTDARSVLKDSFKRERMDKLLKVSFGDAKVDNLSSLSQDVLEGRLLIAFLAMSVWSQLVFLMSKKEVKKNKSGLVVKVLEPLSTRYTSSEIFEMLKDIEVYRLSSSRLEFGTIKRECQNILKELGSDKSYVKAQEWLKRAHWLLISSVYLA